MGAGREFCAPNTTTRDPKQLLTYNTVWGFYVAPAVGPPDCYTTPDQPPHNNWCYKSSGNTIELGHHHCSLARPGSAPGGWRPPGVPCGCVLYVSIHIHAIHLTLAHGVCYLLVWDQTCNSGTKSWFHCFMSGSRQQQPCLWAGWFLMFAKTFLYNTFFSKTLTHFCIVNFHIFVYCLLDTMDFDNHHLSLYLFALRISSLLHYVENNFISCICQVFHTLFAR